MVKTGFRCINRLGISFSTMYQSTKKWFENYIFYLGCPLRIDLLLSYLFI